MVKVVASFMAYFHYCCESDDSPFCIREHSHCKIASGASDGKLAFYSVHNYSDIM